MIRLRKAGSSWSVRTPAGRATVRTLGDAKRVAEAMMQRPLIWHRVDAKRWEGAVFDSQHDVEAAAFLRTVTHPN